MLSYINLRKTFPKLRGQCVHVVSQDMETLNATLTQLGFRVYVIEGSKISNAATFFAEVRRVFGLSQFCTNWDAFDDFFSELRFLPEQHIAIVWKEADQTLMVDVQVFIDAICALDTFALAFRTPKSDTENNVLQMEVFLVGQIKGFQA
jgi:RNAse (barnase) inhibitor barstar